MNNVEGWVSEISLVSTLGKEHYLMDIKHEVYHTKVYKEKMIYRIAMMSIHDYNPSYHPYPSYHGKETTNNYTDFIKFNSLNHKKPVLNEIMVKEFILTIFPVQCDKVY